MHDDEDIISLLGKDPPMYLEKTENMWRGKKSILINNNIILR